MEIEKKFLLDNEEQFSVLTELDSLGDYTLRHNDHVEQQHNTYYDTADRLLSRKHYGLRIREVDGRGVVTLKGAGEEQGGLFRRGEWEVAANDPDPATWPASEARQRVEELLNGAALQPILTIHTRRRHIIALRSGAEVAELSLDSGHFEAGERRETFCELEIELLPTGIEADIEALEAALQEYVSLVPESRSKLARGMALLQDSQEQH